MTLSPRLRERLSRVPDVARAAASDELEACATEIVDLMKALVPFKSGDLRDSIGWTWGDVPAGSFVVDDIRTGANAGDQYAVLRLKIYAGSKDAFYARWIEFGTVKQAARPFFFAAYKQWGGKRTLRARVSAAVKKRMRDELNG